MYRTLPKYASRLVSNYVDTDKFKQKLTNFLPALGNNNHHAAFFHHMIDSEFYLLMKAHDNIQKKSEDFVTHLIPLSDDRIVFLPLYTKVNSSVYIKEKKDYYSVAGSKNNEKYIKDKKNYYAKKESWIAKKILFLAEEFIAELKKINEHTGIPLRSLYHMYSLLIASDASHEKNIDPKEKLLEYQGALVYFLMILLPANIPENERDDLLCSVWEKIYKLLIECYWVLIIVGMIDMLNIVEIFYQSGFEKAKSYLSHSVVYRELEDRVDSIETDFDLIYFLFQEFYLFGLLADDFSLMIPGIDKKFNEKLYWIINSYSKQVPFEEDKVQINKEEEDKDKEEEVVVEEVVVEEEVEEEEEEDWDKRVIINKKSKQEKQPKEPPLYSEITIAKMLQKKMQQYGLLQNYKLKTNPDNVVHYICKIISNIKKTIKEENLSYLLQKEVGVSSSTLKRWKKSSILSINPSTEVIDAVKTEMERRQQHKLVDHYTQNQLIHEIRSNQTLKRFMQKHNKTTYEYGRTALRNKINLLIKEDRITCKKINGVNYFKITDIKDILTELINFSK